MIYDINTHKMYLDNTDQLGLAINPIYEPTVIKLFKRYIVAGNTVLDIGANIGYHSLIMAYLVGEEGIVHSFEPEFNMFVLLVSNIKLNSYTNIVPVNMAVWKETGIVKLVGQSVRMKDNTGKSVKCVAIDDYYTGYYGNVDFIKMDIEGSELQALWGMQKLLRENKSVKLIIEYHPALLREHGVLEQELILFLRNLQFTVYHINDKLCDIVPFNMQIISEEFNYENKHLTNIFCMRE